MSNPFSLKIAELIEHLNGEKKLFIGSVSKSWEQGSNANTGKKTFPSLSAL